MEKLQNQSDPKRIVCFDALRVCAMFVIMLLHVASKYWYTEDISGFRWNVLNAYDCFARWGVPAFVMISGALMLRREIPLKTLYSKYILRLAAAYVFWSAVYALPELPNWKGFLIALIEGDYHMWFIPMLIGVYMCIPFLKRIAANDACADYFLLLGFLFSFLIPELLRLAALIAGSGGSRFLAALDTLLNNLHFRLCLEYPFYFLLGYRLHGTALSRRRRVGLYILGALGFAATLGFTVLRSLRDGAPCEDYLEPINLGVLPMAAAVFVFFQSRFRTCGRRTSALLADLSKITFGAYLVHVLILRMLNSLLGLNALSFNPIFAVPVVSVLVFVISYAVSALLNRIPGFRKYFV